MTMPFEQLHLSTTKVAIVQMFFDDYPLYDRNCAKPISEQDF